MKPGYIVRLLRTAMGSSQIELAEALGISRAYLSQIERDRVPPSIKLIRKIAKHLELPVELLISEDIGSNSVIGKELERIFINLLRSAISFKEQKGDGMKNSEAMK